MRIRTTSLGVLVLAIAIVAGCTADAPGSQSSATGAGESDLPQEPDWMVLYEQELAAFEGLLREQGLEVPTDAEFVRFIEPDEYGRVHAECMREQGFDAEETFDGGVSYDAVPPDQAGAQQQALYRCQVQYPVHPRFTQPLTEDQIRLVYDHFVGFLVDCLTDEGYEVPAAPSWETFLADYHSQGGAWHPYDAVEPTSDAEWQEINEKCPQNPPLEELYSPGG